MTRKLETQPNCVSAATRLNISGFRQDGAVFQLGLEKDRVHLADGGHFYA